MSVAMYLVAPIVGVRVDIMTMLGEMLGWRMGMLVHAQRRDYFSRSFMLLYQFTPGLTGFPEEWLSALSCVQPGRT